MTLYVSVPNLSVRFPARALGGGIAAVGKEELVWERVRLGFSSSSTILCCHGMDEKTCRMVLMVRERISGERLHKYRNRM